MPCHATEGVIEGPLNIRIINQPHNLCDKWPDAFEMLCDLCGCYCFHSLNGFFTWNENEHL